MGFRNKNKHRQNFRSSRDIVEEQEAKHQSKGPGFLKRKVQEFKERNSPENRKARIGRKKLERDELRVDADIAVAKEKKQRATQKKMMLSMSMGGGGKKSSGGRRSSGRKQSSLDEPGDSILMPGSGGSLFDEPESFSGMNEMFGMGSSKSSGPRKSKKDGLASLFS